MGRDPETGRDPAAGAAKTGFRAEEQLSGLHNDLNGAIRRAGPEPSGLEAHVTLAKAAGAPEIELESAARLGNLVLIPSRARPAGTKVYIILGL